MNQNPNNQRPIIGASLLQLGATKKKNVVVNYLLLNMAKVMLSSVAPDDAFTKAVKKAADSTKGKLKASHTKEELQPIEVMSQTAVQMAYKLANCDDVDTLNACLHYMTELNEGKVFIMDDVEDPEAHGLTPNM